MSGEFSSLALRKPRIVMGVTRGAKPSVIVCIAVSPGMSAEGHAGAQGWMMANMALNVQRIWNSRRRHAVMRADMIVKTEAARARCVEVVEGWRAQERAEHAALWYPIHHAGDALREKGAGRACFAYNSPQSMVN